MCTIYVKNEYIYVIITKKFISIYNDDDIKE